MFFFSSRSRHTSWPRDLSSDVCSSDLDYHYLDVFQHPPGATYLEALPEAPPMPWNWLSEEELDYFVSEYTRTGFTGGLKIGRASWRERSRSGVERWAG